MASYNQTRYSVFSRTTKTLLSYPPKYLMLLERASTSAKTASRNKRKLTRYWFKLGKRMKKSRGFGSEFWPTTWFKRRWKIENKEIERADDWVFLSLTPLYLRLCLQYLSSCHGDLLLAICTRLHNITEIKNKKHVSTMWKETQIREGGKKKWNGH